MSSNEPQSVCDSGEIIVSEAAGHGLSVFLTSPSIACVKISAGNERGERLRFN